MPIFRVKSVKIYTGQKNLQWRRQPRQRQLSGMYSGFDYYCNVDSDSNSEAAASSIVYEMVKCVYIPFF